MTIFYSKSSGGFYSTTVHNSIPVDAVEITEEQHAALLSDQASGKIITVDNNGNPIAVLPESLLTLDQIKALKIGALNQSCGVVMYGLVSYMGTSFQADVESVRRINGTVTVYDNDGAVPSGFYWLDANNNQVSMTLTQLKGLAKAVVDNAWMAFQHLQTSKASVIAASTKVAVNSITW